MRKSCPENFADKTLINRKIQNHSYGFVQSPNPATPKLQHRLGARLNRRCGASTITRSKEAPSPTRLYESINMPATRWPANGGRSCATLDQDPLHHIDEIEV
jgi:hypothetical protein